MILRFLSLFALSIVCFSLSAQPISSNIPQLDFNQVNELQADSLEVVVRNHLSKTVNVTSIKFFQTYGQAAFSTSQEAFSLAPKDSQTLKVYFQPRHNILHNTEMVLLTDSHQGSLSIDLRGQGIYSNTYYSSTRNLDQEALKSALKTRLAQGFQQKSYNQGRDQMYMVLDNWKVNGRGSQDNKTVGAYSGRVASPYTSRSQAQVNFSFDTEHIFPQGRFNQNLPMRSDVFHLVTTWTTANSTRGNLNFGNVTNADWTSGGSKRGNGVFEPRDDQKGRNARAMFYFVVRYQNYQNHMTSAEETVLRQWHKDFAPDDIDRRRNEDIFSFQKNRNPFIDYPQFIDRISSIRSSASAPDAYELFLSENSINYDTVFAQQDMIYEYVVVNDGNKTLDLSNFSLADTYLDFADNSGDNLSLAPGEAHTIRVRLNAPANSELSSSLTFDTNIPGGQAVTIPITAVSIGTNSIDPSLRNELDLQVFPNPAKDLLYIKYREGVSQELSLQLYSLEGKVLTTAYSLGVGSQTTIPLQAFAKGTYFLKVSSNGKSFFEQIWVE